MKNAESQDHLVKIFRPAMRSAWFLFFGLVLGPAVVFFERDAEGPGKWIALSLACAAFLLHRLSLKYTLDEKFLTARAWWGLGREERVTLAWLRRVRPAQGFVGRLAGCGHLEVESDAPDEPGLSLLGQPAHLDLAREIETLAEKARGSESGGYGPG